MVRLLLKLGSQNKSTLLWNANVALRYEDTDWIQLTQGRVPLRSSGMAVIKFGIEEGRLFLDKLSDN